VNAKGVCSLNGLHAAVMHGHISMVRLLLKYGANVNGTRGPRNALVAALSGGHEDIVQLLLENGADFDMEMGELDSVLQTALSKGYETVVRLLLERGVDVKKKVGSVWQCSAKSIAFWK